MKTLVLSNPQSRDAACTYVREAPNGHVCRIGEPKRSEEQSAKFHAICGDVANHAEFMGKKLTKDQWKVLFISGHAIATGLGAQVVPGLEGEFVNIRESSASMRGSRVSSLIEYTLAWCAEHGIEV